MLRPWMTKLLSGRIGRATLRTGRIGVTQISWIPSRQETITGPINPQTLTNMRAKRGRGSGAGACRGAVSRDRATGCGAGPLTPGLASLAVERWSLASAALAGPDPSGFPAESVR